MAGLHRPGENEQLVDHEFWDGFCLTVQNARRFVRPLVTSDLPFQRKLLFEKNGYTFALSLRLKSPHPASYTFRDANGAVASQDGEWTNREYYATAVDILNDHFLADSEGSE